VTCEGYSFRLRKVSLPPRTPDLGEWLNRLRQCLRELVKLQQAVNGLNNANLPVTQLQAIKAALVEWMERHSIYNCDLYHRILLVELPPQDPSGGIAPISGVQQNLGPIIRELFRECFCSTLLPPCPEPAEENCVPIATLTLNCKGGCRVVRICNLEHRRTVVTFPILGYFLEPFLKQLRLPELLTRLCCAPIRQPQVDVPPTIFAPAPRGDFLDQLFDDAMKGNGSVSPQLVFQHLGDLLKEIQPRFTDQ